MTVEIVTMSGERGARVNHTIPNDPTWGSYFTLIEVEDDHVHVGTPLACGIGISFIEIVSVVQLILGKVVTIQPQPVDTIVKLEEKGCPRSWATYEFTRA